MTFGNRGVSCRKSVLPYREQDVIGTIQLQLQVMPDDSKMHGLEITVNETGDKIGPLYK